jgi:polysaccharide export outer membrane protein
VKLITEITEQDIFKGRKRRLATVTFIVGLFAIVALYLGGCVSTGGQQNLNHYMASSEISELNKKILAQAQLNSEPGEYLLGEGDLLRIKVFEAEELETVERINSRGYVVLPLVEKVHLKGITAIEAEEKIETLYKKKYIKDPHVSIFIEEQLSQRVTLVGEFKNPGTYDYLSRQRLLDAIALGGGLSEKAGQIVRIRKTRHVEGQPNTIIVDLDRLIKAGDVQANIQIDGGDVIFIPEAGVFFVDGAVKRPGAYHIRHQTVVQEGLVEAGGFKSYAKKDKVKLVRIAANGERHIIDIDLSKSESKEMVLKDRDILIVEANPIAKFFGGFSIMVAGTGVSFYDRY